MPTPQASSNPHTLPGPHFRLKLPKVEIEIVRGRARNMVRPVTVPVYLIGAANDCDLVLGDPQFSEVHDHRRTATFRNAFWSRRVS